MSIAFYAHLVPGDIYTINEDTWLTSLGDGTERSSNAAADTAANAALSHRDRYVHYYSCSPLCLDFAINCQEESIKHS